MPSNVLLVVLDSVRARNTSLGGHVADTTAFLSEFADRSTLYTQARSPGAKSLTSHTSIVTGLDVEEHNVTSAEDRLAPGYSVFERLGDEGYETAVFSENTWLTDVEVGLKEGFDTIEGPRNLPFPDAIDPKPFVAARGRGQYAEYVRACLADDRPLRSLANGVATKVAWDYPALLPNSLQASTAADVYVDLFLDWEARQDGPWAACINLMDAHIPYEPDAEYDRWGGERAREIQDELPDLKWVFLGGQRPWWMRRALEGLYDGAIAQMDAQLRRLVETLERRDVLDDTLVVVTSDHGEGFGEPSEIRDVRVAEHGVSIHECVVHVPLLVSYPGQTEGSVVERPVSLTRFPDAATAAVDDEGDPETFVSDGPVRVSAVGLNEALRERAGEYVDDLSPFTDTARAVYERTDGVVRKDVTWRDRARRVEVRDAQTSYVVSRDDDGSSERVDAEFAGIADAGVRKSGTGVGEMDDTTRQRLEDLGYV